MRLYTFLARFGTSQPVEVAKLKLYALPKYLKQWLQVGLENDLPITLRVNPNVRALMEQFK